MIKTFEQYNEIDPYGEEDWSVLEDYWKVISNSDKFINKSFPRKEYISFQLYLPNRKKILDFQIYEINGGILLYYLGEKSEYILDPPQQYLFECNEKEILEVISILIVNKRVYG